MRFPSDIVELFELRVNSAPTPRDTAAEIATRSASCGVFPYRKGGTGTMNVKTNSKQRSSISMPNAIHFKIPYSMLGLRL